jgi:integrase/recombinase XerD
MDQGKGGRNMAGKRTRAAIYRRGATYWTRFVVDGVEYRRSLRTNETAVAQRRADEIRAQAIAKAHFGDHRTTWREAVIAWAEHQMHEVGASTMQRYNVSIGQLDADFAPLFVDQIDKKAITGFVARRRAMKVTSATIRRDLVALSSVLAFADDQDWRDGNPAKDRLGRISERRDPIVLPAPADIERIIAKAHGNLAHLIRAAWLTGCRQDELVTADRKKFNRERATLEVIGKGRKLRTVPLSQEAVRCLSAVPVSFGSTVLFHHDGKPYANVASRFRALVVSAMKDGQNPAQFRPFRFHDLRHAFAVNYLRNGGSIYALQQVLGHSSVKVTEIYTRFLTPDEADRARDTAQKAGRG